MGPTACGKTHLAIELAQKLPCDIISVDSAMVYRGMDIGTAKPTAAELAIAPHRLIDKLDPVESYSAGQFCLDAHSAIADIFSKDRIPLLVGGTMLYFRALQKGLSPLPPADAAIRQQLSQEAATLGWSTLHKRLQAIDREAAQRISPQDTQRIQRALEVYQLTGMPLTEFCRQAAAKPARYRIINVGLVVEDRIDLAKRIETRFTNMLVKGFIEEVEKLKSRSDLHPNLPAMRSVGYRQIWDYLEGLLTKKEMQEQAIIATRQLAKRQMTWLRSWHDITFFLADSAKLAEQIELML